MAINKLIDKLERNNFLQLTELKSIRDVWAVMHFYDADVLVPSAEANLLPVLFKLFDALFKVPDEAFIDWLDYGL